MVKDLSNASCSCHTEQQSVSHLWSFHLRFSVINVVLLMAKWRSIHTITSVAKCYQNWWIYAITLACVVGEIHSTTCVVAWQSFPIPNKRMLTVNKNDNCPAICWTTCAINFLVTGFLPRCHFISLVTTCLCVCVCVWFRWLATECRF
jgi:hypothetical protein